VPHGSVLDDSAQSVTKRRLGQLVCLGLPAMLGALCVALATFPDLVMDDLAGIGRRVGDTIVLEPERMVEREFALGKYIDIGDRLAEGRWIVVLYRTGCPACQQLLGTIPPSYGTWHRSKMAFIQIPPAHDASTWNVSVATSGTLDNHTQWLIPVPLVIALTDNRVVDVRVGMFMKPALRDLRTSTAGSRETGEST